MRAIAVVALLCALAAASAPLAAGASGDFDARTFAPAAAPRLLLVTFPTPTGHHLAVGPRAIQYVPRGYATTTLDRRRARALARDHGLEVIAAWPVRTLGVHCVVYRVADGRAVGDARAALDADHRVGHVQAMQQFRTRATRAGDPYFALQRNLHALGLDALHAITTGGGVRIAVIDTGIDLGHPDLAGQFDDHANLVAAVSPGFDDDAHGTAVAGIVAARAGNGTGIVGIAPAARLLAYKACWPAGDDRLAAVCNSFSLALALDTALVAGADIINLSLDGPHDALLAALLDKALARGVIVVAADAANAALPSFPAAHPGVLGVRAGSAGHASGIIALPGEEILSTQPRGSYDFLSGCSFSAAQVSGLAALARALHPRLSAVRFAALLGDGDADFGTRLLRLAGAR